MTLMATVTARTRCDVLIRVSSRDAKATRHERAISNRSLARHTGVAGVSTSGRGRTVLGRINDAAVMAGPRQAKPGAQRLASEHALAGVLRGDPGERDAGVDSELLEGVAEVSADGVRGDVEPLGDLFIGQAAGDQPDDGEL
jgi:hypothetical protein